MAVPFISVVVPLLNEEPYIERLTRSLLEQDYPRDRYEILMADGGSTDATLARLAATDTEGRVRVLANPARTAPAGLNVLIQSARGDIITRVDGHSFVAPDYLQRIVAVMEDTGESVVGGPVSMYADTPFRRALVEALYSAVGVGSVPYRTLRTRAYVASLQTGSFRREVLARVGAFDESLAVVEDLDFNTRILRAGYRLLLDPAIRFWYVPRPSLGAVWRQIHGVGRIKVRVLRKHPDIVKLKYLIPSAFVLAMAAAVLAIVAGVVTGRGWLTAIGLAVIGAYGAVVLGFAISRVPRIGPAAGWLLLILPTLHAGYGTGFLRSLVAGPPQPVARAASMEQLS